MVASDRLANPSASDSSDARISDPAILDNTPPEVEIDEVEPVGEDGLRVSATITDNLTPVVDASYRVDSEEDWVMAAADDEIYDAPRERITFTIDDLEPGPHYIAIRVSDEQGNTRYVSQSATVGRR